MRLEISSGSEAGSGAMFPPTELVPLGASGVEDVPDLNFCGDCEPEFDRYTLYDPKTACFRVLCVHDHPFKTSLLGPTGHLERSSAWIHVLSSVGFAVYALIRPYQEGTDTHSYSGKLTQYSICASAIMFAVSVTYHVYCAIPGAAHYMRQLDHNAIILAIGIANLADASIASSNFDWATPYCVADVVVVVVVTVSYFTVRRFLVPPETTRVAWGSCALGLWRFQHSDREHGSYRVSAYIVVSAMFFLYIPGALKYVDDSAVAVYFVATSATFMLLVLGLVLDNVFVVPDRIYRKEFLCHSKKAGCIMTAHAWWHVIAVAAIVISTLGRELALDNPKQW